MPARLSSEAAEHDALYRRLLGEGREHRAKRDKRGAVRRETVSPGRDSGISNRGEPVLAREGVEVALHANRIDPRPDGWIVDWRYPEGCDECGESCKRSLLPPGEVVYVGDGYSDRCAALASDRVFATAGLARYLEDRGVAFEPFTDFHALSEALAA